MQKSYKHWEIYDTIPEGWKEDKNSGSPLHGHVFITNESILKGGKRALLKLNPKDKTEVDDKKKE